jgi:beta-glucosidase
MYKELRMKRQKKQWLLLILAAGLITAMTIATVIGCSTDDDNGGGGGGGGGGTYTITIDSGITGGTVAVRKTTGVTVSSAGVGSAKAGTAIRLDITPASGNVLKSGSLKRNTTAIPANGRFTMPKEIVTITAVFEEKAADTRPPARVTKDEWDAMLDEWEAEFKPIIATMSITQMAAQMTPGEYDHVQTQDVIDSEIGSILSGGHSGPNPQPNSGGSGGTPLQWAAYINEKVNASLTTPLKIPVIYGYDAMHGNSKVKNATLFPHNVGLGAIYVGDATKGMQAGYDAGLITAKEMIMGNVRWTFGPVLSVPDDIRWGRTYECYSEDVNVVEEMGRGVIRGLHDGGVGTTPKHYMAEGQSNDGKNGGDTDLAYDDPRMLELAKPYIAAIAERTMAIMVQYGQINDKEATETKEIMQDLLKDTLGYRGMIISDWSAVTQVSGANYQAKLVNAINAGLDMVMAAGGRDEWTTTISGIVAQNGAGNITRARLEDATLRILLFKRAIGWMAEQQTKTDPGWWDKANNTVKRNDGSAMRSAEHMERAAEMVSDSLVLLKNDDALLSKMDTFSNILILGTGGDDIGLACGGWSISWQGSAGNTTAGVTIRGGIEKKLEASGKTVTYSANGAGLTAGYDLVIAVCAETPYAEGPGDRGPDNNTAIWRAADNNVLTRAKELAGASGKVILIIYSGRPQHLTETHTSTPDAIIAAWWPGSEAGTGIANVLFGDRDFVGKTPMTWKRAQNAAEDLYPYGHGLKKTESQ